MKKRIEVKSQADFDACVNDGNIALVIGCSVEARENSSVVAGGNSSVVAWENSSVVAWANSSVMARGNSSVEAWGNSSVMAWGNSSVVARENSSVEAWGNSSVVAWGNVFVRLFSAIKIKVSASVVVIKHAGSPDFKGGQQIIATPEPTTGKEWCEFNGIDANAPFKVKNLDKEIWNIIKDSPEKLDMGAWHYGKCDESNWCNTTHCRAGYAICLAGAEGFKLEKKYGAELAGKMIYAVSNPDKELPDFYASNKDAMADIERMAKE